MGFEKLLGDRAAMVPEPVEGERGREQSSNFLGGEIDCAFSRPIPSQLDASSYLR